MKELSPRQQQVFDLREQGLTATAMAAQLGIGVGTVKIYVRQLIEKGVTVRKHKPSRASVLAAALRALRDGSPEAHCMPVPVDSSWRYVIDKALEHDHV